MLLIVHCSLYNTIFFFELQPAEDDDDDSDVDLFGEETEEEKKAAEERAAAVKASDKKKYVSMLSLNCSFETKEISSVYGLVGFAKNHI